MSTPHNWIGIVSREHVLKGVKGGFAMLNHGKLAPLIRLAPGDWLIYYSPKTAYPKGEELKSFTASGQVKEAQPYQAEMGPGTTGFRRDIDWLKVKEVPLADLKDDLDFARGNWGMLARRGMFEITDADREAIRTAMVKE